MKYVSTIVMQTKLKLLPLGRRSYMHLAGSRVNQCLLFQGSSLLQSTWATRDKLQQHNRLPSQLNLVSFMFIFSKCLMVKYLRRTFSKEKQLLTGMAKHSTNLFFRKFPNRMSTVRLKCAEGKKDTTTFEILDDDNWVNEDKNKLK